MDDVLTNVVGSINSSGSGVVMPYYPEGKTVGSARGQRDGESPSTQKGEAAGRQDAQSAPPTRGATGAVKEMPAGDQAKVNELKERDREVRQHEAAHLSAAGAYARSGPQYSYQTGPDGRQYAIGGEVEMDTGRESDPRRTITKAQTVRGAAMAPANPSAQDFAVASQMTQMEMDARKELQQAQKKEAEQAAQEEPGQGTPAPQAKGGPGDLPEAQTVGGEQPPTPEDAPSTNHPIAAYSRNEPLRSGGLVSVLG